MTEKPIRRIAISTGGGDYPGCSKGKVCLLQGLAVEFLWSREETDK